MTNEPKFDEDPIGAQEILNQEVIADPGSDLALDRGENEAKFEQFSAASQRVSGRAESGGRKAEERAGSKLKVRKSKREQRRERKEITFREVERRRRAYLEHGGSVAEGFKLIDDLNEVAMRPFRKPTADWPRGP